MFAKFTPNIFVLTIRIISWVTEICLGAPATYRCFSMIFISFYPRYPTLDAITIFREKYISLIRKPDEAFT